MTQTVKPVSPVDWEQVTEHLEALSKETVVHGEIQFRDQAETGYDLWTLSGRQSLALEEANGDKRRMLNYIKGYVANLKELEARKPCRWFCRD